MYSEVMEYHVGSLLKGDKFFKLRITNHLVPGTVPVVALGNTSVPGN